MSDAIENRRVALILGAGDGIGRAIAQRFAEGGYTTVIVRRDPHRSRDFMEQMRQEGHSVNAVAADIRDEASMENLFDRVEAEIGSIEVCVYNGGANTLAPLDDTSSKLFQKVWELCCLGGFLAAREASKRMMPRGRGTILFSGATSGIRGREGYTAFSSGKFGLRSIAQSAAKELGPKGIHVAHVMINGMIKSGDIARLIEERAGMDIDELNDEVFIDTTALAEAYWFLANQPKSGWTNELDIRTHVEQW